MSRWSFELGKLFGISVRVHATFGLLVLWIVHISLANGGSPALALASLTFIALIFGFVVMHEYGHALTARRFGIGTREITLLPIGGMAHLERLPDKPSEQLWVALAGPGVNFGVAAVAALLLWATTGSFSLVLEDGLLGASILAMIIRINLAMAIFNLLPALPMDGGRVLKALLRMRMPDVPATRAAAAVAKAMAIAMAVFGFAQGQTMVTVIAAFVWIAASAEVRGAEQRELLGQVVSWAPADPEEEWIQGGPSASRLRPGMKIRVVTRAPDGRMQVHLVTVPTQS